jgi:D-alanyl-D-alanine carboxypeptidase
LIFIDHKEKDLDFLRPEVLTAALQEQHAAMAVFVSGKNVPNAWGIAAGMADASIARSLTIDTPLRVASNTKTFVAATVLRLWEQGAISLDAPIVSLLAPTLERLLTSRGYRTDKITVRHLLSHSAGVYDHADDPRYFRVCSRTPRIIGPVRRKLAFPATTQGRPTSPAKSTSIPIPDTFCWATLLSA